MYQKHASSGRRSESGQGSTHSRGGHSSSPSRSGHSSSSHAPRAGAPAHRGFRGGPSPRFGANKFGRSRGNASRGDRIDPSRFINKAVITEEVDIFKPEHAFADFKLEEELKQSIKTKGYVLPTPIQDRAIPHVLNGDDVVGIANTGTGKTAAFLIPLINKIIKDRKERVMIIVPTRELANQIDDELKGFTSTIKSGPRIFSVSCVGGSNINSQIRQLRLENSVVIGTPGRLKDLIERKIIVLSKFNTVVLDEADRMLDMGFINDMRFIMAGMPKTRTTLFFSATMSREIEKLISEFLRNPVRISVKTGDTAKSVDQDVVRVRDASAKMDMLHDLLNQKEFVKVLIFGRTKHGVERLSKDLVKRGFKAESIHGNKNQSGRERALGKFRDNHVQVLVATDVAARGLDISNISHVINYDLPATYDDYVHRIGRTGRGNKKGKALTFVEGEK